MRGRAGLVTEISVFATETSVTGMKIFPYEHSSPVTGMKHFRQKLIASLSQHSGQNGIILVLYVFHFRSMQNSFINRVTRVHKAMAVANNTSLCSTILVVFLEFIPVDRAENSHMNTQQNSSR